MTPMPPKPPVIGLSSLSQREDPTAKFTLLQQVRRVARAKGYSRLRYTSCDGSKRRALDPESGSRSCLVPVQSSAAKANRICPGDHSCEGVAAVADRSDA
jgi:hypothetical protein